MKHLEQTRIRKGGVRVTLPLDASERIVAIRSIVDRKQYAKVDGCMIDLFSASAIVQVFDALNPSNQAKFANMKAPQMGIMAFRLIEKVNNG